jgi:3-dehydroquinate dehydratase-2
MKVLFLNGPNLNLLGTREPEVYGRTTLAGIEAKVRQRAKALKVAGRFSAVQSRRRTGGLDSGSQRKGFDVIVINAAAYTHTSIALRDAISAVEFPRLKFIYPMCTPGKSSGIKSLIAAVCRGQICGFGENSYILGWRQPFTLKILRNRFKIALKWSI